MESDPKPLSSTDLNACDWLVRILDEEVDPKDPLPHPADRSAAFCEWLLHSPRHAWAFFELLACFRLLGDILRAQAIETTSLERKRRRQT